MKPLTDHNVIQCWHQAAPSGVQTSGWIFLFARAIERAHGIQEGQEPTDASLLAALDNPSILARLDAECGAKWFFNDGQAWHRAETAREAILGVMAGRAKERT